MKLNIAKLQAVEMPDLNTINCTKGVVVTRRLDGWKIMLKITVRVDGHRLVWHDAPATPLDMQGWECLVTQAVAHRDRCHEQRKHTICRLMEKLELIED